MHNSEDIVKMIHDPRPVFAIAKEESLCRVGENGVTEIVIYAEGGEMGYINFAAVYQGDFLLMRVDLKGWMVIYKEETNDSNKTN